MATTTPISKAGERTQVQGTYHMSVAIDLIERVDDETLKQSFGSKMTARQIRAQLKRMKSAGYVYCPANGCDNFATTGECLGHNRV